MKITGTKDETAWAFRALEVAGICEGCPARGPAMRRRT